MVKLVASFESMEVEEEISRAKFISEDKIEIISYIKKKLILIWKT